MAAEIVRRSLKASNFSLLRTLTSFQTRSFSNLAESVQPESDAPSSSFTFSENSGDGDSNSQRKSAIDDNIFINGPKKGFFVKRSGIFDDAYVFHDWINCGKEPPLKCPTLALAKAIAAEWEYQGT
ncbi:uncharacterized protein LOC125811017 [Solanum verrucosum]|uniref:uncharacterized protein LOC125811017 n=1 Tax=Solanum verrucosum TaxID=315347 RepID=UPI0020D187B1|nr:uncharacterized protein LOC125811017 [Solanum verrucosum]